MSKTFTEQDVKDVVEFLNLVAGKAQFNMNTQEIIQYFKLLSTMQKSILPKMKDNILEIVEVIEGEEGEQ